MEIITNEIIRTVVEALLIPIMTILSAYIVQLLKVKISTLSDTQFKNYLSSSLDELNQAINTAVGKVAQTYVDSLKKDGKFNTEEQKIALKAAYDTTLAILSNDTSEFLEKQLTKEGFQEMIISKIEELVGLNKQLNNYGILSDSKVMKTDSQING